MTTKSTKATPKPKALSKTKQELRRLREFANQFLAGDLADEDMVAVGMLRVAATAALTGEKPSKSYRQKHHEMVAADVKRLNALGPKGLEKFLAGDGDEIEAKVYYGNVVSDPPVVVIRGGKPR